MSRDFVFLFTDIEGSTRLWEQYPDVMHDLLRRHDEVLRSVIVRHQGQVFRTVGDAFYATFSEVGRAARCSIAIHRELESCDWTPLPGLKVRVGIHAGPAEARDGDYYGPELNRVHRLMSAGHGGQTLLSETAQRLVREDEVQQFLHDMGTHRLRDLSRAMVVYQCSETPGGFPPLRTLDPVKENLPVYLTSFVGRESELATLVDHLRGDRLVTLVGPGGAGKTRLAVQAVAEAAGQFPDGTWFIDLAAVSDPSLIANQIADGLGVSVAAGLDVLQEIDEFLTGRRLVLVLDNCEHVIADAAQIAFHLSQKFRDVTVLATSREPLNLNGEVLQRLGSIGDEASNELFLQRSAQHGATVEAGLVAELCEKLGGLPLAIELVAARSRSLPLASLRDGLVTRLAKTNDPSRTNRQQSFAALVDWSLDLLEPELKQRWQGLAVFRGAWNVELSAEIWGIDSLDAVDTLSALVDKSLIVYDPDSPACYRWLRPLQEHAQAMGIASQTQSRHAQAFKRFVLDTHSRLSGDQVALFEQFGLHHTDILEALLHLTAEEAADVTESLASFWEYRGHWQVGYQQLQNTAARCQGATRAKLLISLSKLARRLGRPSESKDQSEAALREFEELDDKAGQAEAWSALGAAQWAGGNMPDAKESFLRSLAMRDPSDVLGQVISRHNLGVSCLDLGQHEEAVVHASESLRLARQILDHIGVAMALTTLGNCYSETCRYEDAVKVFSEAADVASTLQDRQSLGTLTHNLGLCAMALGRYGEADQAFRRAEEMFLELGDHRGLCCSASDWTPLLMKLGHGSKAGEVLLRATALAANGEDARSLPYLFESLALLWHQAGEHDERERLLAKARSLRRELGHPLSRRDLDICLRHFDLDLATGTLFDDGVNVESAYQQLADDAQSWISWVNSVKAPA